jgi:hypothetical protein
VIGPDGVAVEAPRIEIAGLEADWMIEPRGLDAAPGLGASLHDVDLDGWVVMSEPGGPPPRRPTPIRDVDSDWMLI